MAVTGKEPQGVCFIVQETFPPYCLYSVELSYELKTDASEAVNDAIDLWAKCLRSNSWPSYSRRAYVVAQTYKGQERKMNREIEKASGTHEAEMKKLMMEWYRPKGDRNVTT